MWKADAELGMINTRGNTHTEKTHARATVGHEEAQWRNVGRAEALRSTDKNVTAANRYEFSAKSDYKFNARSYGFGSFWNDWKSSLSLSLPKTITSKNQT